MRLLELGLETSDGDVDVFLTCEWPALVTAATPPGSIPEGASGVPDHCSPASCVPSQQLIGASMLSNHDISLYTPLLLAM